MRKLILIALLVSFQSISAEDDEPSTNTSAAVSDVPTVAAPADEAMLLASADTSGVSDQTRQLERQHFARNEGVPVAELARLQAEIARLPIDQSPNLSPVPNESGPSTPRPTPASSQTSTGTENATVEVEDPAVFAERAANALVARFLEGVQNMRENRNVISAEEVLALRTLFAHDFRRLDLTVLLRELPRLLQENLATIRRWNRAAQDLQLPRANLPTSPGSF